MQIWVFRLVPIEPSSGGVLQIMDVPSTASGTVFDVCAIILAMGNNLISIRTIPQVAQSPGIASTL